MRSALLALALLAAGTAARAQTITSPYRYLEEKQSLSLYGGYLATDPGDPELAPRSAPMVGLEYAIRLSGPLLGKAAVSYLPGTRDVYAFTQPVGGTLTRIGEVDTHLLAAEAGLRFQVTGPRTWHALAPFVGAEVGLVMDLAPTSDLETGANLPGDQRVDFGPSFAVGLSAGTDWFLTERISLRGLGRGSLWRFSPPESLTGSDDASWLRNFGGTLGLAYHF